MHLDMQKHDLLLGWILKLFFPSFSEEHLGRFFSEQNSLRDLGLSSEDLEFLVSMLTRNGAVTIGAPSSPAVTNAMMYEFDSQIFEFARMGGVIYTRYADDLFVSAHAPDLLEGMSTQIVRASGTYRFANLNINNSKTAYLSKRYRRAITGLIITSDGKISIGRERKRKIRAMVHQYTLGQFKEDCVGHIGGLVAFAKGTDTEFYAALEKKYGESRIKGLLRGR